MAIRLRRRLQKFGRDESAATAVEFALLVTPLITLILASLQLSIIFFAGQALQTVAVSSARQLMTGQAQLAGDNAAQYKANVVCPNVKILFACTDLMVDVQSSNSYATINTASPTITYDGSGNVTNSWSYHPGNPGDIVILRIMYNWPVVAAPLMVGIPDQPNGNKLLVATSVFKAEPY
ncbi:MAG TPA: TadE/TadG family type IV pilus assembly protein [Caulobacteraceae bacterium]|jgi:Flp pilus assembly protein TadG